jgi:hypothetical protein
MDGYIGMGIGGGIWLRDASCLLLLLMLTWLGYMLHSRGLRFRPLWVSFTERTNYQELLDDLRRRSRLFTRCMEIQTVILLTLLTYMGYHRYQNLSQWQWIPSLELLAGFLIIVLIFMLVRRWIHAMYCLMYCNEETRYQEWTAGYRILTILWGVTLYIPLLGLLSAAVGKGISIALAVLPYVLYRLLLLRSLLPMVTLSRIGVLQGVLYVMVQEVIPVYFLYKSLDYMYHTVEYRMLWH